MFVPIKDYAARAMSWLVQQFKSSDEFRGVLNTLSAQLQQIEDANAAVIAQFRNVNAATGGTLNNLGKLVGAVPRGVWTDAEYRRRVKVQILVNKSDGTAEDLTAIAKAFFPTWDDAVKFVVAHTRHEGATNAANAAAGVPNTTCLSIGSVEVCTIPFNPGANNDQVPSAEARELARYLKTASVAGTRTILKYVSDQIGASPVFTCADPGGVRVAPRGGAGAGFGVGKLANSLSK